MIKLIAIDLDGTLLDHEMDIPKENIDAIKQAREKGIKIVICTGRPYVFTKIYIKLLDLGTPTIMFNGGEIKHKDLNRQIFLDKDQVRKTLNLLHKEKISYMLYTEDTVFYRPSKRVEYLKEMSKKVPEDLRADFKEIQDYERLIQKYDFNKVLIVEQDESKYQSVYDMVKDTLPECDILQSSSFYIEVLPKGISKGNALRVVADYYGIKQEEIMAIGDQENDLSMILYAGIGIAMKNANPKLLEVADDMTDTNDKAGVSKAIHKYVL